MMLLASRVSVCAVSWGLGRYRFGGSRLHCWEVGETVGGRAWWKEVRSLQEGGIGTPASLLLLIISQPPRGEQVCSTTHFLPPSSASPQVRHSGAKRPWDECFKTRNQNEYCLFVSCWPQASSIATGRLLSHCIPVWDTHSSLTVSTE